MIPNRANLLLDQAFGSSGKGKFAAWLCEQFDCHHVSSSNFPNAGHTVQIGQLRFVAKAIPTAAFLNRELKDNIHHRFPMTCWLSPGSGFDWQRLVQEWGDCGCPQMFIHGMASVVTGEHQRREEEGSGSTTHIASTRQGSSAAMIDKILRKFDCMLAGNTRHLLEDAVRRWAGPASPDHFVELSRDTIHIVSGDIFREMLFTQAMGLDGHGVQKMYLHEGSQGYALSLDHGPAPHYGTSRNCTAMKALDDLGVPPQLVGDVYLNVRTFPIRVGHIMGENGEKLGDSGPFYPDSKEITWEQVAQEAGMPDSELDNLLKREHTTVTKRLRRVSTFSWSGFKDAVRTNGATKLILNFAQYLDWQDNGLKGGREAFDRLSHRTRTFVDRMESETGVKVALIGTGAAHDDVIVCP